MMIALTLMHIREGGEKELNGRRGMLTIVYRVMLQPSQQHVKRVEWGLVRRGLRIVASQTRWASIPVKVTKSGIVRCSRCTAIVSPF